MSKCKRCGANVIRSVALADGVLCYKCFDELGFDKDDRKHHTTTAYNEIIDRLHLNENKIAQIEK